MRTNIDLDEALLEKAFTYAAKYRVKSKKDLVHLALREFVENHSRLDVRDLRGKVELREDYDHKRLRLEDDG